MLDVLEGALELLALSVLMAGVVFWRFRPANNGSRRRPRFRK